MTGILPDNPDYTPLPAPWGPFSTLPVWWHRANLIRRKRPGRPRMRELFAKFALAYRRGRSEEAYETVADQHGIEVESVKRQVAREKAWLKEQERRERGGLLGK